MTWLGYDRYCTELEAEAGRIADAVHDADLALRVPTCPEWTLVDLVQHVGAAHRWAADMIERRVTAPVRPERADPPPEPDARSAWLLAGGRRLNEAVRAAGPRAAVWTWSTDQTAGFWSRRILHDTLVHRFDAEIAVGRAAQREDRSLRGPQSQASHTVAVAPVWPPTASRTCWPRSPSSRPANPTTGCAAPGRRCISTPPTRGWTAPASGWCAGRRPAWSGSTDMPRATWRYAGRP